MTTTTCPNCHSDDLYISEEEENTVDYECLCCGRRWSRYTDEQPKYSPPESLGGFECVAAVTTLPAALRQSVAVKRNPVGGLRTCDTKDVDEAKGCGGGESYGRR